jgi:hypothetical protein
VALSMLLCPLLLPPTPSHPRPPLFCFRIGLLVGEALGGAVGATCRAACPRLAKPVILKQELQLEIWDREKSLENLIHEASRVAKRRHVSIDLFKCVEVRGGRLVCRLAWAGRLGRCPAPLSRFLCPSPLPPPLPWCTHGVWSVCVGACVTRYIERAYLEQDGEYNYTIGLEELCMITRVEDIGTCECVDGVGKGGVLERGWGGGGCWAVGCTGRGICRFRLLPRSTRACARWVTPPPPPLRPLLSTSFFCRALTLQPLPLPGPGHRGGVHQPQGRGDAPAQGAVCGGKPCGQRHHAAVRGDQGQQVGQEAAPHPDL